MEVDASAPVAAPVVDGGGGGGGGGVEEDGLDQAMLAQLLKAQGLPTGGGGGTSGRKRRGAGKKEKGGGGGGTAVVGGNSEPPTLPPDVVVEYVVPDVVTELKQQATVDPSYAEFQEVFEKFERGGVSAEAEAGGEGGEDGGTNGGGGVDAAAVDGGVGRKKLSKKARREMLQLSLGELKRSVEHPEVIEAHDVTAADPQLLIHLKSSRNTVPVPRHWSHKSRYLSRKRGFEKPPFALPAYIVATGITKMRNEDLESQADKSLKSRTRERYLPKMGKIEIDYQILHDAFFKHQTKPALTGFGDLYYEGREFEMKYEDKKPGVLSDRLKEALGMQPGYPPPWLVKMQQYGPPPAYPTLRIPGVNAPLPAGAMYGTHVGGWGRPPVDAMGRPLYGDVFGVSGPDVELAAVAKAREGGLWGEYVMSREELALSFMKAARGLDQVTAAATHAEAAAATAAATRAGAGGGEAPMVDAAVMGAGVATPVDGTVSVSGTLTSGLATPDVVNIRKGPRGFGDGMETPESVASGAPPQLYRVLEERKTALTGTLLGTSRVYVIPPADGTAPVGGAGGSRVAVALNPEDLDHLDASTLSKKYEDEVAAAAAAAALKPGKDDISDLLEEQERKRKRREAGLAGEGGSQAKRAKEFKF